MGDRDNAKELTNNLCMSRYFAFKKREHKSPLLKCRLHIVTSFQRAQHGKRVGGMGK